MQKYLLKQQFKGFFVSTSEGLHKGYDRFQTLLSQLDIYGVGVLHKDANQKFLRSLPSSWSQVALIIRTKPGLDTLSFNDLYNNLRVFKHDVKGTNASSSNTQNVAFVSADNTSSTNDINDDDIEEIDLKWQVVMISMRIKKFHKRTGRKLQFDTKDLVGFDKTKVECFNCHKMGHFARDCRAKGNQDIKKRDDGYNGNKTRDNGGRPAYHDDSKALVTIDGEDIDWSGHVEEDAQNYAMIAYSFSNSGSDNEASGLEDTFVNDRYADGMHAVPPPMIGNYMPFGPDVEIDYSKFTYGPKQISVDESDSKPSKYASCESDSSVETTTSMPKPRDRNAHTRKSLGYAFTRKACFVCGSFSHLIRDCDFHEKRMAKQAELTKSKNKVTGQRENRPVWNNVQRVNHQNKFVPSVLLTKTGNFPVNAARQNYSSQAASPSTASKVNTARPFVNEKRPKRIFYKTRLPNKRPFHNTTTQRTTFSYKKVNDVGNKSLSVVGGNGDTVVKASAGRLKLEMAWVPKRNRFLLFHVKDDPHRALKDKRIIDSGCSTHMTGNKAHLADYQKFKGGSIAFGDSNGRITGKRKIKTDRLDFEDVYYVEELKHYNLFSVSQICDKKNNVLFTDADCLVLSLDFKLLDENQIFLKIPRQHNIYSFNLKNINPSGDLSYLFTNASIDESNKWHRRLSHVNFKNLNKLVKGNLVRSLPSKIFENDHTCVACQKGKQHKASCKAKTVSSLNQPLQILHMDLFGPTSVRSINHKTYCLVITDGFSRFSLVYFLKSKDETTPILKNFTRQAKNQFNHKVKSIRSDNKTEFKNKELIKICRLKGIKRGYSNARTPQQNEVVERKNKNLIEAARTIKAFRVHNLETKRVEENMHVNFLVNKPNVARKEHAWMFNLDYLTNSMNYEHVLVENQAKKSAGPKEANNSACTQANDDQSADSKEIDLHEEHFVLPIWSAYSTTVKSSGDKIEKNTYFKTCKKPVSKVEQIFLEELEKLKRQEKKLMIINDGELSYPDDPSMPHLEDIYASLSKEIFTDSSYDDEGVTRSKVNKNFEAHALVSYIQKQERNNHKNFQHCLFACFLSQIEPKKISQTLEDESWVDAMQEELLQFQIQKCDEFEELMKNRFQMSSMDELTFFLGLQVKKKEDGIFISQDKYVAKILKKFDFLSVKTASTPIKTQKPLVKDKEAADVDVTPKTSHLQAVKRIFRYLKGQPKLGLWYPKLSSFDLEAYSDSDYTGASLDRKSTTGDCQFLGRRLISWQCKKQTIVATSTTKAEYVAANPVFHSKTKHIEIRHYFIRDAYEKKLIKVLKIHTNDNVADSLTKAFDVSSTGRKQLSTARHKVSTAGISGHTSDRVEGSLNMEALYALCTNLSNKVLALETVKDAQAKEILILKAKIKKLEKRCKPKEALNKGRQSTLSTARPDDDTSRPDISTARQELSTVGPTTTPTTSKIFDDEEMTLEDTLIKLKDDKAKVRWSHEEQEKYTVDERAKLLVEYFKKKKQLAKERATAIRNKPPTKTQLRRLTMTYLKNIDFVPIGSEEDERMIRDMKKKAEEESSDKGVDNTKKKKGSRMKRMSKRYPLTTRTLKRMMSLRLIVESASDAAYDLLRFIQKQIDESGGHDRGEKDI
uniref:Putative ribonuclease H-like domain-containing protein n=1 Tax=Tanacetum cinerariifolium TaxID=118510 RepID=A0A6L2MNC8_TANCI|nr:putative ribonuclease H-like domain-containing protein [Tanacetum cinerariifolium]